MKKTATITYHKSQNFGSILQTYALQQFILSLDNNLYNDVINIQPTTQKELYNIFKKNNSLKNIIYNIFSVIYYKQLDTKRTKFNEFLNKNISLTKNIEMKEDLLFFSNCYNYLISGSDQIWNVRNKDFEDFYYLNWQTTAKKISYAASFGPLEIDWDKYDVYKYRQFLMEYDYISTREKGSYDNVKYLAGIESEIHVDPTLLLDENEWR